MGGELVWVILREISMYKKILMCFDSGCAVFVFELVDVS